MAINTTREILENVNKIPNIVSQLADNKTDNKHDIRLAKKPLVTFTWDDGMASEWQVKDIFVGKGVPYVVAQVAGKVGNPNYLSWEQLRTLQDTYGCEISSHTMTHAYDLADKTYEQVEYEIGESYRVLNTNGIRCNTICIPHGRFNDTIVEVVKKYYKAMRVSLEGINTPPIGTFFLNEQLFGESSDPVKNTLDYYKQCVDRAIAEKGWLIFLGHGDYTMSKPDEQTKLATLIDYIKSKNVEITTMTKALKYYGNVIQNGAVREQNYRKMKFLPHFALGADGSVSSNYANVRYLEIGTVKSTDLLSSFEDDCVSIAQITDAVKAGFPLNEPGTLYTHKFYNDPNYSYQEYVVYRTTDKFTRMATASGWGEWLPEQALVLKRNSVISTTKPSELYKDRVFNCMITSEFKAGFPEGTVGTLTTSTLGVTVDWRYAYQLYHIFTTGAIYKRVAVDANTWGDWIVIYRERDNTGTNGQSNTTLPNAFPRDTVTRTMINSAGKAGFPESASGLLETYTYGSTTDYGYTYQLYHLYGSAVTYKRPATNATTWGAWSKISAV